MVVQIPFGAVPSHSDSDDEKLDSNVADSITIDEAIEAADGFGRYQKRITAAMGLAWVGYGAVMLSTVFTTMSPGTDDNFTSILDEFPTEWHSILRSAPFVGSMVGTPVWGVVADRLGRKPAVVSASALCGVFMAGAAISFGTISFWVFTFLSGLFSSGLGLVSFTLASEVWGQRARTTTGNAFHMCFTVGMLFCIASAYTLLSWRLVCISLSLLSLPICIAVLFTCRESPRWLLANGRKTEAEHVMNYIARFNASPTLNVKILRLRPADTATALPMRGCLAHLRSLCSYRHLRRTTILLMFMWYATGYAYYGINMTAEHIGSSVYITATISAIAEVPGFVLSMYVLGLARVSGSAFFFFMLATAGYLCILTPPDSVVQVVVVMVGKVASCGCFASVYLLSAELFPTSMRNSGTGISSLGARLAAAVAPGTVEMFTPISPALPLVIFGSVALLGGIACLWGIRETLGHPICETVGEFEATEAAYWSSRSRQRTESHDAPDSGVVELGEMKDAI